MTDTPHRAFFGDGEHAFQLTAPMILELERTTGAGIGVLFQRVGQMMFNHADLVEVIRLGLVGAGTDPQQARRLVDAYAVPRPISEVRPLAWDILKALWFGAAPAERDERVRNEEAVSLALKSDPSAAINAALADEVAP